MGKNILYSLITTLFLCSCGTDREELFVVNNEIEFIIKGGLNTIETHYFVIKNVPTFLELNLQNNGYSIEDVKSIGSGRGLLRGSFQGIDYDFIQEISVDVVSQRDNNIKREMFYRAQIPFTHDGDLELLSSISELKDLLSDPVVNIEVGVRFRKIVNSPIQNKLIFSYAVFDTQ